MIVSLSPTAALIAGKASSEAEALVELAAEMVRDDDSVDADLGGADRIGRVQDPLDHERAREQPPIAFEIAPGLRRGRGLAAAERNRVRLARPWAGMRQPIPQAGRAAMPDVVLTQQDGSSPPAGLTASTATPP